MAGPSTRRWCRRRPLPPLLLLVVVVVVLAVVVVAVMNVEATEAGPRPRGRGAAAWVPVDAMLALLALPKEVDALL